MNIDRKYTILAVNPSSGREHTEEDSVLFLPKDRAFLAILPNNSKSIISTPGLVGDSAYNIFVEG